MNDDVDDRSEDSSEPGTIGVGMGGSCPSCRAPVDLGQEFCLECGAPIRFTPKQRAKKRSSTAPVATSTPAPRKRSGFPWVPFLIVLALVGGGVAFALVDGGDGSKSSKDKDATTESALPTITNETEPPTTSSGMTTTLEDCDPARPLDDTEPAVPDGQSSTSPSEVIPSIDDAASDSSNDSSDPFDSPTADNSAVPSIEPSDSGTSTSAPVTVDQNGNLCASDGASPTPTPAPPAPANPDTDSTDTTTTTTSSDGAWPAGKNGWTVIVSGYDTEARAQQRAADVQEDGYQDSGVLFSSDFTSLCPGYYVVFSGVFTSRSEAETHKTALDSKPDYAGMYVREVRKGGTPASGCKSAT